MSYMDVLWIKIATSYPKWPLLARTQSLSHCGHPSIKLRNTSTGKPAAAFRRDPFKHSILGYVYLQAISWSFGPQFLHQGGLGLGLQKANLKWRWSPEYFTPSTAGLSVPCVLELSPAESSSSVHGRGCCKKRDPNIESLKRSLRKAAADFPVDMLTHSIEERPQRFKDCVHANGGHFEYLFAILVHNTSM